MSDMPKPMSKVELFDAMCDGKIVWRTIGDRATSEEITQIRRDDFVQLLNDTLISCPFYRTEADALRALVELKQYEIIAIEARLEGVERGVICQRR